LKEVVEKFQEISVTAPEVLHSQERGVSLLNQQLIFFIYEPAIYTIQHNTARLHNTDETGITIVQYSTNTRKY
jgi:hypothetical protein